MKRLMDQGAATRAEVNLAEQNLRSAVAQRGSLLSARAEPSAANDIRSRIDYLERSISYLEGLNGSSYDVTLKSRQGAVRRGRFRPIGQGGAGTYVDS